MLLLKGFIVGIAKIIPGVSGAMLAISLGIYEDSIKAINDFFKSPIKSILYLMPIGIGLLTAIAIFSKIIIYLLHVFYLPTMLLFVGLIIGGVPLLVKNIDNKVNIKSCLIFILSFSFVFVLSLLGKHNIINNEGFTSFLIIGGIDAATMVIPGISGTAVMMLLGCYDTLLNFLSSLINIESVFSNIDNFLGYSLGIILFVLILSKIINYLFQNKKEYMYAGILGFALNSIFTLLFFFFLNNYNFIEVIVALIFLILGYKISKIIG